MRIWTLLCCLLCGCGVHTSEVVLVEMQNAHVGDVPLGLRGVESRRIWRQGRRISVDLATLLRFDDASKTIRADKVLVGDDIVIAGTKWSVVRMEAGTDRTLGRVLLRASDP